MPTLSSLSNPLDAFTLRLKDRGRPLGLSAKLGARGLRLPRARPP